LCGAEKGKGAKIFHLGGGTGYDRELNILEGKGSDGLLINKQT